MSSSVRSTFAAAGLEPDGSVGWGARIPRPPLGPATGVYAVSWADDPDATRGGRQACPLSKRALADLMNARPELRLDSERPDWRALGERIGGFWLAGEPILYIGLAGPRSRRPRHGELAQRVDDYYGTKLGARSPHAGGWFLKTLSILGDLVVHYAFCEGVAEAEQSMLEVFATGVSPSMRKELHDSERVMPFANLEHPPGNRKRHGITGATAPRTRRPATSRIPTEPVAGVVDGAVPAAKPPRTAVTQIVRPGDVSSGIIRVPKATKRLLPESKGQINVELRGDDLGDCLWNPGIGPDKDRSGVIRIGKAAVSGLVTGEQLVVERTEAGIRLT